MVEIDERKIEELKNLIDDLINEKNRLEKELENVKKPINSEDLMLKKPVWIQIKGGTKQLLYLTSLFCDLEMEGKLKLAMMTPHKKSRATKAREYDKYQNLKLLIPFDKVEILNVLPWNETAFTKFNELLEWRKSGRRKD